MRWEGHGDDELTFVKDVGIKLLLHRNLRQVLMY